MAVLDTHWMGIPEDYYNYAGFVYDIKNTISGRRYIGRKYFFKKKGKALIESDWKTYISSSAELKKDIHSLGIDKFEFIVLGLGSTKTEVNYLEVKIQMELNVLTELLPSGEFAFYNKNILSKYFQPKEAGTPEYLSKCANISEALKRVYSRPDYKHHMLGRVHPNKGKKLPQTGHQQNKGKIWFTDGNINLSLKAGSSIPEGFERGLTIRKPKVALRWLKQQETYNKNPSVCAHCNKILDYSKRKAKFCSKTCQNKHHSTLLKARVKNTNTIAGKIIQKYPYKDKEYTTAELAVLFGVSPPTVLRRIRIGKMPDEW